MRNKIEPHKKRSSYIGIKVKQITREQLDYISKRDQTPISTIINNEIQKYIEEYFKITKINWETLSDEEKKGGYKWKKLY